MSKRSFMPKMKGGIYKLIFILVLAVIIYFAYSFMRMKEGFQASPPSTTVTNAVKDAFITLIRTIDAALDFTKPNINTQVQSLGQSLGKKLNSKQTTTVNGKEINPSYTCMATTSPSFQIQCTPPPKNIQKQQGINLPNITYKFEKNPTTKNDNTNGTLTFS